jgi:hypothetical protein
MPRSGLTSARHGKRTDRGHHSGPSGRSVGSGGEAFYTSKSILSIDRTAVPVRPTLAIPEGTVVVYTESGLMASLLQEIGDLKTAVRRIESHLGVLGEAISLREIPDDEARTQILSAFQQAGDEPFYYDDLSEKLRLPIEQVARLCEALIAEGVLGEKVADER